MKTPLLEARDVYREYLLGKTVVKALRGVDVVIHKGDFVFIVGPSGSGKSTLMHILGALDHPTKGSVLLDGKNLARLSDWQLSMVRRNRVGFVFQGFNLVHSLNAKENVMLPLQTSDIDKVTLEARAIKLLMEVGLKHRINHRPNELSGGERQRVATARALINEPEIILADEPTGELDSKTGAEIMGLMRTINKEKGTTFVIVTHDTEYITEKDKVFRIRDGKIIR
ncbi:MAG: ABC transporter ATP-binding protein [Candidatus Diapherotrites archaeon]|nr:ABC transporter ATP-binding protein [Candidatus Diapherotrites archaeon]